MVELIHLAVADESDPQVDLPLHSPGQSRHVHILLGLKVEHADVLVHPVKECCNEVMTTRDKTSSRRHSI